MIVYIATYPRCGNSLVRDVVQQYFQYPSANIYPYEVPYPRRLKYTENWRMGDEISRDVRLARWWLLWNKWMAVYDLNVPPHTKNNRFLVHGCKPVLKRRNRWRLAREKNVFFLKTHDRPFHNYFPGEYVIQIVRHPGPVFRSYYNLLKNDMGDDFNLTMEHFISGNVHFGSWSDYHAEWDKAVMRLKDRYLRVRYEEVVGNIPAFCEAIQGLTGLPYDPNARIRDFETLKKQDSGMFGFGSNRDWEKAYTPEQLDMIYTRHSDMMRYLGYPSERVRTS